MGDPGGFLRQARGTETGAQLVGSFVAGFFTELCSNGSNLFAEERVSLDPTQSLAQFVADLALDLEDFALVLEGIEEELDPRTDFEGLEYRLPGRERESQIGSAEVGQIPGIVDSLHQGGESLLRITLELEDFGGQRPQGQEKRLRPNGVLDGEVVAKLPVREQADFLSFLLRLAPSGSSLGLWFCVDGNRSNPPDAKPGETGDHDLPRTPFEGLEGLNPAERCDRMKVPGRGVSRSNDFLADDEDHSATLALSIAKRCQAPWPPDH